MTVRRGPPRKEGGPRRTDGAAASGRSSGCGLQRPGAAVPGLGHRRHAPVAVGLLTPTAEQKVAEVHDTEKSALNVAGLGVATLVQVVPFHWAATVVSAVPAAFWSSPTAMQFVAEMHDTELSSTRSPEAPGSGTVRAVQVPPVHCSARGAVASAVLDAVPAVPTAMQAVVAGQDTLCQEGGWLRVHRGLVRPGLPVPVRGQRLLRRRSSRRPCSSPWRGRTRRRVRPCAWWSRRTISGRSSARPGSSRSSGSPRPCSPWPRCRRCGTGSPSVDRRRVRLEAPGAAVPPLTQQPVRSSRCRRSPRPCTRWTTCRTRRR